MRGRKINMTMGLKSPLARGPYCAHYAAERQVMARLALALLVLLAFAPGAVGMPEPTVFSRPPELESAVRFWTRVYTEVDTNGGFLHDNRKLDVVYEVVRFKPGTSRRAKQRQVNRLKSRYRKILNSLAKGKRSKLSAEQSRVLALWPEDVSNKTLRTAARRLRFQLGQADKFRAGLVRSGAWTGYIRDTFQRMDVPVELAALPHVESSFNPAAYSHRGAAGIWQFTRSTGRRYLRIDHVVDERMDVYASTVAAARLLKHNHSVTGSWPLAITAYNHGASGMRRAVRRLGTRDIGAVVERYRSRTFGFASRNFYAAFLAAVDVEQNAYEHFGPLTSDTPAEVELVELSDYVSMDALERVLGINRKLLKRHNRALQPPVWNGSKYVPKGYELRVPRQPGLQRAELLLAQLSPADRHSRQTPDSFHKVRRGDTLSRIAARYEVTVRDIMDVNSLRSRHRIRAGQVLRLPLPDADAPAPLATADSPHTRRVAQNGNYTVRRGDTLSGIAKRFGVSEHDIVAANALSNQDRIFTGQTLSVAVLNSTVPEGEPVRHVAAADNEAGGESPSAPTAAPEKQQPLAALEAEPPGEPEAADDFEATTVQHPSLSADPSDYTVAQDGTVEVQAAETLGHYAEWLDLRASQLRRLNRMRYGTPVVVGHRLRLDFSRASTESFETRRLAYHKELQEAFFERNRIVGVCQHVIQRGESLWFLAQQTYGVPMWLLRQYNPDLEPDAVVPGLRLQVPRVEQRPKDLPQAAELRDGLTLPRMC
ncbi:MAG: LysM peptidoglycan-binding domain-containing protein [Gammaproteobacteria bacterium]|nr:LysM peptidoglycan-binding domain-containing protein [Gammaproteobacteria bacterium]